MTRNLPTGRSGQLLAAGLLLVALGVIWLAIASPLIGWYGERAEALSSRILFARRLAGLAGELPTLERTEKHLAAAAPARNTLLDGSTDAIAAATLQQTVQQLASEAGATLSSAATLPAQADGDYRRIRLRITIRGDWPVLVHLLRKITTGRPTMLVDDLRLTGPQTAARTASSPLTALFTVIAFRAGTAHPSGQKAGSPDGVK